MKEFFNITKKDALLVLENASRVVGRTNNFYKVIRIKHDINEAIFTATNGMTSITRSFNLAHWGGSFDALFPLKELMVAIKATKQKDYISIGVIDGAPAVRVNSVESVLPAPGYVACDDLKQVKYFPQEDSIETILHSNDLNKLISSTSFAVNPNEPRKNLRGVYLEFKDASQPGHSLTLVSTDGKRLCRKTYSAEIFMSGLDYPTNVLIPIDFLNNLAKIMPDGLVTILVTTKEIKACSMNKLTVLCSALLQEEYVPYEQVIPPDRKYLVTFDANHLLETFGKFKPTTKYKHDALAISIKEGKALFTAGDLKLEVACPGDHGDHEIKLNIFYLLDVIKGCELKELKISFDDDSRSVTILGKDYICVIMQITR